MLTAVLFFAVVHASVKHLTRIPFFELVFFRALITFVVSAAILKWRRKSLRGNHYPLLLARGAAGAVALTLYFFTLQKMPLATAVTLQHLSPVFALVFAGFLLKEKTSKWQWLALVLAFLGVLFVKGFDARVSMGEVVVGVMAAAFSALAYNFVRMLKDYEDALVVVFYFPLVTLPLITPVTLYYWVPPTWSEWPWVLAIGLCTQISQVYMTKAYQAAPLSNVVIVKYLGIVFALAIGWLAFDEPVQWLSFLGMILIVLAVLVGSRLKGAPVSQ